MLAAHGLVRRLTAGFHALVSQPVDAPRAGIMRRQSLTLTEKQLWENPQWHMPTAI
jgi:hypothetical protein